MAPFLLASGALLILRVLASRRLGWRLVSVGSANLLGITLFVATGVFFGGQIGAWSGVALLVLMYASVLLGELLGVSCFSRLAVRLDALCEHSVGRRRLRVGAVLFVVLFLAVSLVALLRAPAKVMATVSTVWGSDVSAQYSEETIDALFAQAPRPRLKSLLIAVNTQLQGLFLLATGFAAARSRNGLFVILFLGAVLQFLGSGGGRTPFFLAFGVLVAVALDGLRRKGVALLAGLMIATAALLALGYLREARSGQVVSGSVVDQIAATLQSDFSYGGRGLWIGQVHRGSLAGGALYLGRIAGMAVPRSLWPSKPTQDPNWEMTEAEEGKDLRDVNAVNLFTPLGEALFYFGPVGLVIVPLLYGGLSAGLERAYGRHRAFAVLRAHVVLWAFLAWRLTLWNLVGALVIGNAAVLGALLVSATLMDPRGAEGPQAE